MRIATRTQANSSRSLQLATATMLCVASTLGCAHTARTTMGAASQPFAKTGALLSAMANGARAIFEAKTVSLALDRIDQRTSTLDHTYRHAGTGAGVTVYVFDGGILSTHPELQGRVRKGFDGFPDDPAICNAHGTAVAGAIAGTTLGVAPDAEIVDVKMVQCERLRGTIKAIVDGAKWTIADHAKHGGTPAVANWSFIADTAARIPALDSAVAALRAAGIAVVVSAGNVDVNACRVSPGNADGSIVVGASALWRDPEDPRGFTMDRRAPGTAWGPCVDVYAPGDSVLLPSLDRSLTPTVQLWNGTSMSAGYVSGAIALFLESNPSASPDDVHSWIVATATPNVVRDARSPMTRLLYVGARK